MRIWTRPRRLPFSSLRRWRQGGVCLLLLGSLVAAEPTVSRVWTSANGMTVNGRVLRMEDDIAELERADGPVVRVPLTALLDADQQFLAAHFGAAAPAGAHSPPSGSGAAPASGLPYEAGKPAGPVKVADDVSYYVYIPKSLKQDRKAPLMLITHSGGGVNPAHVGNLSEGAELTGMILAVSVESRNGMPGGWYSRLIRPTLDHLLRTLPVDPARVYFAGHSGGAAVAMTNMSYFPGNGAMPNIGYCPQDIRPGKGFYFVTGGARDYNRYLSADIARVFGDNAVHRMIPGGHIASPAWLKIDGIFWLNARYLGANKNKHADEARDFEARSVEWLRTLSEKSPQRAYSNARILKDDYQLSGPNLAALNALLAELAKNPLNVRYHEGLIDIDQFAKKEYTKYKEQGSLQGHEDSAISRKALALLEKYRGVPQIEETIADMALPTVGPGNR